MKDALFYTTCLCFFYLKCTVGVEVVNNKLNDYLNKKSESLHDTELQKLKEEVGYFEIEENTRSDHISGDYKCVFSLFNETFILLDNDIYNLELDNGMVNLKKFSELENRGNIIFTKVTQYEDLGFILTKTEMEINIYGFENNNTFFVHSIFAPYASDAHFFINQNFLYLILVNNKGENLAISIIYKWLGTYFDETEPIFTTGAIKVTSFTDNFFEIIVILQYSSSTNPLSTVYEFNFGRIKKIQHIKASDPSYIDVFKTKVGTYVLVFEKSKNNLIYSWNGSKLMKTSQFQTETVISKSVTITSNNLSIIAVRAKDKVQTYLLLSKEIRLIGEKILKSNDSHILDIHKKGNTNNTIYVVGLDETNTTYINVMSFKAYLSAIGSYDKNKESLRSCFHTLENSVYRKNRKLKGTKEIFSQVKGGPGLFTNTVGHRASDTSEIDSDPVHNLNKLRIRLDELRDLLNDYQGKDVNNTVINKRVIIKGTIKAEKLRGKDVKLKTINGRNWTPQFWLRYKEPQTITGPIRVEKIVATELNTTPSDPLFTELVTKNEHLDIWGEFKIANLTVNKIQTKNINDIEVKNIYLKSDPQLIQGLKTFEKFHAYKAKINILNEQPLDEAVPKLVTNSLPRSITFDSLLEVENLIVDTINDINWNTFKDSVFKIGITNEISGKLGDLILTEFHADNITLKTIKGVKVDDLLTTSTEQIIDADIEFAKVFAKNITTNSTNDIKLSESAVQFENNTLVEVPVKFNKLYVKNIKLIGKLDKEFFLWSGDHIKGTNESDLWQSYEKIVKINGNLYVKNFTLQPDAKLFVDEEEFNPDVDSIYWTKNTSQSIPTHFEAQNGLNVSLLFLNKLNGIDFNQYMLNKDGDRFETSYHFENISILRDVLLNSSANHTPNLTKLNEEAVKTTGSYFIKGKKIYTGMLTANNLEATTLGGVAVNDILNTKPVLNITGEQSFKNLIIKGNLTCDLQSVGFINGVNITHLLETAIYIDKPQNIEKLHFKNVTVEDLWVTKINNQPVNRHIENVEQILSSNKINSIMVNGSVVFNKITNVSKINNIKFEKLLNSTWKQGKSGGILVNLEFSDPVKVGNLITAYVNHLDLRKLTKRFLYRNMEQDITAFYSFQKVKTENLAVSKINGISMENLIDVSTTAPQTIYAPGGIEFSSAILQKSLNANKTSPCNLIEILKNIRDPPIRDWNNVEIKGNTTFLDPNNILYRVFEKAVTNNTKNVIQAPVEFSKHILAKNIITEGLINGINLQEIIDDAVLLDADDEQIITGRIVFPTMRISDATVIKNADIPDVNSVDIPVVNKLIVRKDDVHNHVIKGKKTFFGGLQCENFHSEKVSNIYVNEIVTTENLRKIPKAAFDSVHVQNDLNISSINSFDFDGFLKTRLLTHGMDEQTVDGVYFFDNIQAEDMRAPSINNITMDNVVFDIGQQIITASKHFTAVEIFGNLTCPYINGINISEIYKKSIPEDENTIEGSLTLLQPSVVKGNITTEYVNGYPVQQIKEILNQGTIKSEIEKIHHIKVDIVDKIKRNIDHIKFLASDYMYIEKTQALQISVPNTISAKTMESKGYVLIHVNGEESGEHCGLLESCKCPIQYSIEVSPEHSVAIFPNKGTQRIFTYNDDGMIVHFLTNSFSTDSKCRTDNAKVINEVSMMTWNTPANGNITGSFHQFDQFITGYISGAEFFTLHGHTYAIIGRYYNPTTNSHDLDCYLIKFSHDKSTAEIIQEIATRGAWSVYLFHTAQGVTLIIGNIKTTNIHQSEEDTKIYRFNEHKQQFDLLKIVLSYGCSMATGVVLGTDSLIVLAHRYAPLQVLKYNSNVDNYYFYQSFELEAPVVGISVFYTGGFGISDAYLCTVTANENYFIYSFQFIEGWKLESSGELEGLKNLIPFELNKQLYLFAPSLNISSLLTVVKHGSV